MGLKERLRVHQRITNGGFPCMKGTLILVIAAATLPGIWVHLADAHTGSSKEEALSGILHKSNPSNLQWDGFFAG